MRTHNVRRAAGVVATTAGILAAGMGAAHADAGAAGVAAGSPGVGSGNAVQVPVDVPVNACGNTVNVIGLLNPTFGNSCANVGNEAHAKGAAVGSPGVLSGNLAQAPVNVPVNLTGNTVNVIGLLNAAAGNSSANVHHPHHPCPHECESLDDQGVATR